MSSGFRPVSTLTTPPGTSDVASTSVSVTAGSGRVSDASTTTELPATSGGASRETRPRSDDVSGATMPTTPARLRDREVEVRGSHRVRRAQHLADLVGPARVPDPAVDRRVDGPGRGRLAQALRGGDLVDELVAPALHQLGDAVQDLAAVHRGLAGPAGERLACGAHRVAQVLARGASRVGERRAVRRRDEVGAPGFGPRERPADVQLVRLADGDPGRGRGGGRRLRPPCDGARRPVPAVRGRGERRVAISGPPGGRRRGGRACRPRARSRIACSRRTATSDRSG